VMTTNHRHILLAAKRVIEMHGTTTRDQKHMIYAIQGKGFNNVICDAHRA